MFLKKNVMASSHLYFIAVCESFKVVKWKIIFIEQVYFNCIMKREINLFQNILQFKV